MALVSAQEPTDRAAVVNAIRSTDNLGDAAKRLGCSRKTLYNRMRQLGLPRGQAGRPKRKLHRGRPKHMGWAAAGAAVIAGVALNRRTPA